MIMPPGVRKFALVVHVTSSVGWLGAVLVFLAMSVIALTTGDPPTARGAYLVMKPTAWLALAPLAFASLLSGMVQALGTAWGLLRHYWILFKLLITVFITFILLMYMETFAVMASGCRSERCATRGSNGVAVAPFRAGPADVACGGGAGGLQAARNDPVRMAQAIRAFDPVK